MEKEIWKPRKLLENQLLKRLVKFAMSPMKQEMRLKQQETGSFAFPFFFYFLKAFQRKKMKFSTGLFRKSNPKDKNLKVKE